MTEKQEKVTSVVGAEPYLRSLCKEVRGSDPTTPEDLERESRKAARQLLPASQSDMRIVSRAQYSALKMPANYDHHLRRAICDVKAGDSLLVTFMKPHQGLLIAYLHAVNTAGLNITTEPMNTPDSAPTKDEFVPCPETRIITQRPKPAFVLKARAQRAANMASTPRGPDKPAKSSTHPLLFGKASSRVSFGNIKPLIRPSATGPTKSGPRLQPTKPGKEGQRRSLAPARGLAPVRGLARSQRPPKTQAPPPSDDDEEKKEGGSSGWLPDLGLGLFGSTETSQDDGDGSSADETGDEEDGDSNNRPIDNTEESRSIWGLTKDLASRGMNYATGTVVPDKTDELDEDGNLKETSDAYIQWKQLDDLWKSRRRWSVADKVKYAALYNKATGGSLEEQREKANARKAKITEILRAERAERAQDTAEQAKKDAAKATQDAKKAQTEADKAMASGDAEAAKKKAEVAAKKKADADEAERKRNEDERKAAEEADRLKKKQEADEAKRKADAQKESAKRAAADASKAGESSLDFQSDDDSDDEGSGAGPAKETNGRTTGGDTASSGGSSSSGKALKNTKDEIAFYLKDFMQQPGYSVNFCSSLDAVNGYIASLCGGNPSFQLMEEPLGVFKTFEMWGNVTVAGIDNMSAFDGIVARVLNSESPKFQALVLDLPNNNPALATFMNNNTKVDGVDYTGFNEYYHLDATSVKFVLGQSNCSLVVYVCADAASVVNDDAARVAEKLSSSIPAGRNVIAACPWTDKGRKEIAKKQVFPSLSYSYMAIYDKLKGNGWTWDGIKAKTSQSKKGFQPSTAATNMHSAALTAPVSGTFEFPSKTKLKTDNGGIAAEYSDARVYTRLA